jgi:hypothetical protein
MPVSPLKERKTMTRLQRWNSIDNRLDRAIDAVRVTARHMEDIGLTHRARELDAAADLFAAELEAVRTVKAPTIPPDDDDSDGFDDPAYNAAANNFARGLAEIAFREAVHGFQLEA